MRTERKNEYWHIIVEIQQGYDGKAKLGNCVTYDYIHDGYFVPLIDNKRNRVPSYKLVYLGRIAKDINHDLRKEQLFNYAKSKDLVQYCTWMKKYGSKNQ